MNDRPIYLTKAYAMAMSTSLWGTVNHTYKTTGGKGVYYTSNSGHGGYIIDGNVFREDIRAKIEQFVSPTITYVAVNNGKMMGMQNPFTQRSWRYDMRYELVKHPIFVFEEDCDWAIVERFADIRLLGAYEDTVAHEDYIQQCYRDWHCPIMLGEVNLRSFGEDLTSLERNFGTITFKLGFEIKKGNIEIDKVDAVIERLGVMLDDAVHDRKIHIAGLRMKLEIVRALASDGETPRWVTD